MTLNDAILQVTGGPTVNDGLRTWYSVGVSNPQNYAFNDLEKAWLKVQLPASTKTTINDLWMEFLSSQGGMVIGTLNDMLRQYWVGLTTPPVLGPNEHNLTVGNGSSAVGFLDGGYGAINPNTIGAQTISGIYVGSNDVMYVEFVGDVQVGTFATLEVSGPNGVVTCSWSPTNLSYRSIVYPGLFSAMSTEVGSIITIEIVPS